MLQTLRNLLGINNEPTTKERKARFVDSQGNVYEMPEQTVYLKFMIWAETEVKDLTEALRYCELQHLAVSEMDNEKKESDHLIVNLDDTH